MTHLRIKVHEAYRKIAAISDPDLLGKKFIDGNMQIDVKESFYGGEEYGENEAIELMKSVRFDDGIFNIVGKHSIDTAVKAGIIDGKGIIKIQGIPHALGLL